MKAKNTKKYLLSVLFLIIIMLLGFFNLKNLMDYYVNDAAPTTEWIPDMGDKFETDYASVFEGKNNLVNINGLIRRVFHQNEMNGVTKLNNGWLASIDSNPDLSEVEDNAKQVNDLNIRLRKRGIPLLYVVTPDTVSKYDDELPEGITDYTNLKLDTFIGELVDVDYLDMREEFHNAGINQYSMFYKTDHHWNVDGGMYAASCILQYAQKKLDMNVDDRICNKEYYNVETYPKWHLGSKGQRVGKYYAGIDDFSIMYPQFDTSFTRVSDDERGDFKDVFISYDALKNKKSTSRYTYDFTYKYSIEREFHNELNKNGKRLVVISDSMGRVVTPYLALAFENMYCTAYESINDEFLEEHKPDMVVIILHPNNIKQMGYLDIGLH